MEGVLCVGNQQVRKIARRDRLRSETPNIETPPFHYGEAVAIELDLDGGLPTASGLGLPLQAQSIGRRKVPPGFNRQMLAFQLKEARSVRHAVAVVISVRSKAVIENDVLVV